MLLLFVLLCLWQSHCGSSKGKAENDFSSSLKTRWYGPSYQPRGWSPSNTISLFRSGDFSYDGPDGPDSWAHTFRDCGGKQQSPINIQTENLKKRKNKKPLKWTNYSKIPKSMVLQNSGHSIHANGIWKNSSCIPYITNGPLEKHYYFSQLHFHWGKNDSTGSEHTINKKRYPLEMHVVHDRIVEDPTNLSEESNSNRVVVVAYMFEIVKRDNPNLRNILDGIKEVEGSVKKKTSINPFPLDSLIQSFRGDYVSYKGSLTTPPCTEGVIWIINSRPLGISDRQVRIFWQNINRFASWSIEFIVQGTLSLLSYCLFEDMLDWLENKARICEIILAGFVLILIAIYLDDWLGILHCFKSSQNSETFRFGYRKCNGPSVWKEHYESALGQKQSPINVLSKEAVTYPSGPLKWEYYSTLPESMFMYNDGYSIMLHGNWRCGTPKLSGMPLGSEVYVFNKLYFHWGPTDSEGSEHTLDFERFPLEVHMIFLKEGFNSLMEAHYNKCSNGIVIVAFLFEITPVDNPGFLNAVTDNLHKVKTPKSGCCIKPFALNDIYPEFEFNYYKYDGSITQPPCSEIVTYIIQSETIAVSKRQMSRFRKLLAFDGKPMINNSRPVQKLNHRTVYYFKR